MLFSLLAFFAVIRNYQAIHSLFLVTLGKSASKYYHGEILPSDNAQSEAALFKKEVDRLSINSEMLFIMIFNEISLADVILMVFFLQGWMGASRTTTGSIQPLVF